MIARRHELRDPLAAVPPSRHPFQIWSMMACFVGGVSALAVHVPGSVYDLLPRWGVVAWGLILTLGGALAIISGWWRDRVVGLLLERTALTCIAVSASIYGMCVLALLRAGGVIPAAMAIGIGIAGGWRVKHVNVELKKTRLWLEGLNE